MAHNAKKIMGRKPKKDTHEGVNASLYLSIPADAIMRRINEKTDRSNSEIVSKIIERWGPEAENDLAMFNGKVFNG
jgi:hypothetical protein